MEKRTKVLGVIALVVILIFAGVMMICRHPEPQAVPGENVVTPSEVFPAADVGTLQKELAKEKQENRDLNATVNALRADKERISAESMKVITEKDGVINELRQVIEGLIKAKNESAGALSAPILIGPVAKESIQIKPVAFCWKSVPGAQKYIFELSQDSKMEKIVVREIVETTAYEYPKTLWYSHTYFWRVGAVGQSGAIVFSDVGYFTTEPVPPMR